MAKTVAPGTIQIAGVEVPFSANAVPDPFDERDLEYRPRLAVLPPSIDQRDNAKAYFVLQQTGNSCTGHAVAGVINTVLARAQRRRQAGADPNAPPIERVSPYMIYRLARRYDEFLGEKDVGSSLRGAFKGWFHHGVAPESAWPLLDMEPEPDLDDPAFARLCRERPLGAFYRVNPYRLDDMQSAITELNAIAVSSAVHEGWVSPAPLQRGTETIYVIQRPANARTLGGHAYILVGYNDVGFLVQNSWGKTWGKGGFATLPYEDWLDSAYDAWVARPGVPQTPFYSGRTRTARGTSGELVTVPDVDLRRLAMHVVNLGNNGRLSDTGKFTSSPAQIERIFTHMARWHDFWQNHSPERKRHIVFYAHGGLTSEEAGLQTAQRHLNWWLNNGVYPVYFAYETDAASTVMDRLQDLISGRQPAGGIGFDLVEQFDRLVENVVRNFLRWTWDEMKQNARAASEPLPGAAPITWPPEPADAAQWMQAPGASLTVTRLKQYVDQQGAGNVCVHLVGHSAGSIFHAAMLQRLVEAGIKVDSIQFLAPGLRVDEFMRDIVSHLEAGKRVDRFAVFNLNGSRELQDVCPVNGQIIYHKSLLYLVSRAFDVLRVNGREIFEVPLLGMELFFDRPLEGRNGQTLRQLIEQLGGQCVFAPSPAPSDGRSDARYHGGIQEDPPTMTSVVMRMLGVSEPSAEYEYQTNAPLRDTEGIPQVEEPPAPAPAPAPAPTTPQAVSVEVAVAPRSGSPIMDVLKGEGWSAAPPAAAVSPAAEGAVAQSKPPEILTAPPQDAAGTTEQASRRSTRRKTTLKKSNARASRATAQGRSRAKSKARRRK